MSEESHKPPTEDDAALEREIRSRRKFSIAEAIGREGADLMKGASPVTRKRQAEFAIEECLERHLDDADGALRVVLLRRTAESEILLAPGYEDPLAALALVTERLLGSEARLRRLVDETDAEWGRLYSERPYFERGGGPPHHHDPYTLASVRQALSRLLAELVRDD